MLGVMLLLVQTVPEAVPTLPVSGPILQQKISAVPRCDSSDDDDDIVICGKTDPDAYRLRPLGQPPGGKPLPPMTMRLNDRTTGEARAEERCVTQTICAPALMARVRMTF